MKKIIIACVSRNNVIGNAKKLPWKIKEDMNAFKKETIGNTVIMGSNTYYGLDRPLKNRKNIVLSKNKILGVTTCSSFEEAFNESYGKIFIIGGQKVFENAMQYCDSAIITKISKEYFGDTFFPDLPWYYELKESESTQIIIDSKYELLVRDKYEVNVKKKHQEYQYIELLKKLLVSPSFVSRNGNARFIFSPTPFIFDIRNEFPLLTTKKISWEIILDELLFFLAGKTDTILLKSSIWKGNTTKKFLDSRNLNYPVGDMGPMYGFILRHYGQEYINCKKKYVGGFDQIKYLIEELQKDPFSRRLVATTFDPSAVSKSVLMPCHGIVIQLGVSESNGIFYVDMHMYQRSGDIFLGVPFNIASYAAKLTIICKCASNDKQIFLPRKLIMSFGNVHLYEEHVQAAHQQLMNEPFPWPTLEIENEMTIDTLSEKMFKMKNYQSHERIHGIFKP